MKDFKQESMMGVNYIGYGDENKHFPIYVVRTTQEGENYTFYNKELAIQVAGELATRYGYTIKIEIVIPLDVHPKWGGPPA